MWLPALAAILLTVAAIQLFFPASESDEESITLVVLPFENLGPEEEEYFSDGITEAVTSQLSKISGLKVISRTSAIRYKNSDADIEEIADELGVGYIVAGAVYWDKTEEVNRVRINVSLADAEEGTYLWTESFERVLDKIFAIQADISQRVSQSLGVVLTPEQREIYSEPTANLQAYDLHLRGNDYFGRSWDFPDIKIAIEMYQRAVKLDSGFALAYAMLARGHASMYWEFFDRSESRRQMALQAARRAMELAPNVAESYLAMGYYYYHCELDYRRALLQFEKALKLQPNNSELLNAIAAVQRRQGKLSSSAENFKKALVLDPSSHLKAFDVGLTYGMMRKFSEADRWLDRTIVLAPDWPLPYIYKAWLQIFENGDSNGAADILERASKHCDLSTSKYYWWLVRITEPYHDQILQKTSIGTDTIAYYLHVARINRMMGRNQTERAYSDSVLTLLLERAERQHEEAHYHSNLGLAYTGLRDRDKALRHGKLAIELLPTSREAFDAPFLVMNLTESLVVFKEYNEAVRMLELLMSVPGFVSSHYLKLDPLWLPLHDNEQFQLLVEKAA
jgi:TolB-like protein/Tfp pilus assembly protein PilF